MPNHVSKIVNTSIRNTYTHLLGVLDLIESVYETGNIIAFYTQEGLRVGPITIIYGSSFYSAGWRRSSNPEGVGSYTVLTEDDKRKIEKLISLKTKVIGYDLLKEEREWG